MTVSAGKQTISDPFCNQPRQKSCSSCGESFTCGPATGKGSCWCEDLPHVSLVAAADQDCLCPACLSEAIAKLPIAAAHIAGPAGSVKTTPALVEGEDYYCEGAAIVFTAQYLRRRGYCCESGCRHCPYEIAQIQKART